MQERTNKQIINGLFWTFGERFAAQLVSTIIGIILARILVPEDYGIISIVTIFITVFNVFVTSGFSSAIVQKKEVDQKDYDTAFSISLFVSIVAYLLLFFTSPLIAAFYEMPVLTPVIKVMSLRLPLAAMNSVQQAYIRRSMVFKLFFISTLLGTVLSGIIGITVALNGVGVWALVVQYLANTSINTFILWFICQWKPKGTFSLSKAKEIFSFGWKVLFGDLIATVQGDIRSLVIGKVFGPGDLAFFDQGKKYPALFVNNLNTAINKVMLPAYSRIQENRIQLKEMLRKSIQIGLFILAPIMIGLASVSNNFVMVLLTEKWLPSIPYIQIFCIYFLTRPIETSCQQSILALGRSDIILKIMIVLNVVALSTMLIATFVFKSILLIAIGLLITTAVSLGSYLFVSKQHIGYTHKEQFHDFAPPLLSSFIMGGSIKLLDYLDTKPLFLLILQILTGIIIYFICSILFQRNILIYSKKIIKQYSGSFMS